MSRKQRSAIIIAFAFVFALAGVVVALAIPPCSAINNYGWCDMVCMYRGGCAGYAQICISGQGYIASTCGNGSVYNSICHADCGPGGGGSPVFRKPPIPTEDP